MNYYFRNGNDIQPIVYLEFDFDVTIPNVASADLTFTFLNFSKKFPGKIDWNFQEYGKLWNYNLQYFNYLHQANLDNSLKENWLKELSFWLQKGKLESEPYPISIRSMNVIRFCSKNQVGNEQIMEGVYAQLKYLNQNLEYHVLGNHLLENAFALMMGGYVFSEESWTKKSRKILCEELNEQILNDGGHFELSPMYHQIILFRVLELIDWYKRTSNPDRQFLSFVLLKAGQMLGWLKNISFKNGDIPYFNDSAPGIAFSSHLLFEYAKRLELNAPVSLPFKESGYRKFCYSKYECVIDVAAVGPRYQPGHGHADALSFILYYGGLPFLVEAGTSTYQIGEKRSYERSTQAHNTVVIGERNQSEVWSGFRVGKRAKVILENESQSSMVATHDGYVHNFGVLHKRYFNFDINSISILDEIGDKNGKAFLHFHPDCEIEIISANAINIAQFAEITIEGANQLSFGKYEYADGFNQYRQADKLEIDFDKKLNTLIKFQ
ncbi:MAG: alginate lyase family protein [Ferruginibacter sp.]